MSNTIPTGALSAIKRKFKSGSHHQFIVIPLRAISAAVSSQKQGEISQLWLLARGTKHDERLKIASRVSFVMTNLSFDVITIENRRRQKGFDELWALVGAFERQHAPECSIRSTYWNNVLWSPQVYRHFCKLWQEELQKERVLKITAREMVSQRIDIWLPQDSDCCDLWQEELQNNSMLKSTAQEVLAEKIDRRNPRSASMRGISIAEQRTLLHVGKYSGDPMSLDLYLWTRSAGPESKGLHQRWLLIRIVTGTGIHWSYSSTGSEIWDPLCSRLFGCVLSHQVLNIVGL